MIRLALTTAQTLVVSAGGVCALLLIGLAALFAATEELEDWEARDLDPSDIFPDEDPW